MSLLGPNEPTHVWSLNNVINKRSRGRSKDKSVHTMSMHACSCASLSLWVQDATVSWPAAGGVESEALLEL